MHAIVVGNGHLSIADRLSIWRMSNTSGSMVVRFNDMKSWKYGEPMDIHVTRLPSGLFPLFPYTAQEWYVTVDPSSAPLHANRIIPVYEDARRDEGTVMNTLRIFPTCWECGRHCAHNWTTMGPSTGALVLSYLEDAPHVRFIDVFAMNWNGDLPHNDFRDKRIIRRCCLKCTIHRTPDTTYGDEWGTLQNVLVITLSAFIVAILGARQLFLHQNCKGIRKKWSRLSHHDTPSGVAQKGLEDHSELDIVSGRQ